MRRSLRLLIAGLTVALASAPAVAQSKGDWTLGVGVHQVNPKSGNGALDGSALGLGSLSVDVDSDVKPTITAEYFIADNLGIEVLAAQLLRGGGGLGAACFVQRDIRMALLAAFDVPVGLAVAEVEE